MPVVKKAAKETLSAVELNRSDVLHFDLGHGRMWQMRLLSTSAEATSTNLQQLKVPERGGRTNYRFACEVAVNGRTHLLQREVSTQQSFYEPWLIDDVLVWFDAVDGIFEFLNEAHGDCRPRCHARFALQVAGRRICPEPIHPWCPLPEGGLKIEMCYSGEDCWLALQRN